MEIREPGCETLVGRGSRKSYRYDRREKVIRCPKPMLGQRMRRAVGPECGSSGEAWRIQGPAPTSQTQESKRSRRAELCRTSRRVFRPNVARGRRIIQNPGSANRSFGSLAPPIYGPQHLVVLGPLNPKDCIFWPCHGALSCLAFGRSDSCI